MRILFVLFPRWFRRSRPRRTGYDEDVLFCGWFDLPADR